MAGDSQKRAFLAGGGKCAELIAAFDWSTTPLGPIGSWPSPIKTTVGLMLRSPIAIVTLWGEQGTMIYNDAYSEFAASRHPKLLGSAVREGWPEVAAFNDNIMKVVLGRGETISYRDFELVLYRRGSPEPESVWFNLDYSPVLGDDGKPIGVIAIVVEITETHHANIRVRESEARFRALTNASSNVTYRMSADWGEMRHLHGRGFLADTSQPNVRWMNGYLFPEDIPAIISAIDKAIQAKGVFEFEHRVRSSDGTAAWTFSRAVPLLDERGEITEWFGSATNITARRENETRLQFLDELGRETAKSVDADTIMAVTTRMLGEHLGVTSCAYADMDENEDGFTIRGDWAAKGAMHIIGHYSLADFGGLAVQNLSAGLPLIINNNLEELLPEEAAAFQSIGISATICMPLVKEGRLTALMAIHHKDPHIWTGYELSLLTEVTERSWAHIERVRSEAEVREGERRFREELEKRVAERTAAAEQGEKTIRTVFETSYMNQGLLTTEGKIVYVNATSLASINSRFEDVVGKDFWDTPWFTGTPGMPEQVREGIKRVAAGESIQISMPLNMPTGHRIYEFSMRPAIDENGKVIALVPEAVEITARVRAEQNLQQAQKLEALGNLTGGIAHDFNNLLMAILGSLELLAKRLSSDPGLKRLVDNAMEGAKRGKSLTARMLVFARKQDFESERIQLGELVHGMAELMARSLGPMISVDIQIPPSLPLVEVDSNQIEAALLNLVVNARDAMRGEGSISVAAREVEVRTHDLLKPGSYVCLSVTDTGEGMNADVLKRATEPFFTTKGVGKGTGLGLSMVHGIAEESGGALILQSTPGKGTTAEIWLPAAPSNETGRAPRPQAPSPPPAQAGERLNILAVDDDPLILMSTVDMLEDLGHTVVGVASGAEALDTLARRPFDVVVTDHAMPRMTGAQLIGEIRPRFPGLPIVLATGYAELPNGDQVDAERLAKPFSQDELAVSLAKAIQRPA